MESAKGILAFLAKKEVYGLAIIVLLAIVFYHIGKVFINKIIIFGKDSYEIKKRRTIVNLISNIFRYVIWILFGLFA